MVFMSAAMGYAQERTPEVVQRLMEQESAAGTLVRARRSHRANEARHPNSVERIWAAWGFKRKKESPPAVKSSTASPPTSAAPCRRLSSRTARLQLVREFAARPDVEYAQPNYILRISDRTPNDPRYPEQWHYFSNGAGSRSVPGRHQPSESMGCLDRQPGGRGGRHRHRHPAEPPGHPRDLPTWCRAMT
ncbi:MAG: hypothetical protein MZV70_54710 [Desulfobacterales bacterium]|nr:hypothetical protein [Desulfobacterales bacterium]